MDTTGLYNTIAVSGKDRKTLESRKICHETIEGENQYFGTRHSLMPCLSVFLDMIYFDFSSFSDEIMQIAQ